MGVPVPDLARVEVSEADIMNRQGYPVRVGDVYLEDKFAMKETAIRSKGQKVKGQIRGGSPGGN